jgi:putative ABC transport system permease protein
LILGDARPEPVQVAEITASAFRVARVPPLFGRPLIDSDEQPGAPAVVVLGYTMWQSRFGGRQDVIGQTLQLGRAPMTIVGVMPEGFAFPLNHNCWIPLPLRPSGYAPLEGPAIRVFGRLAPAAQVPQALAEVTAATSSVAATSPATHQHLRPRVFAYGAEDLGSSWIDFAITHGPVLLILIVACANVGTLVYARTATREAEIATRHALGASRARIIGQLFVEALVLAAVAAVVGLFVADQTLRWVFAYLAQEQALPFWIRPGLKLATVIYAGLLAVIAAGILGALPAIKATASGTPQLRAGGATLRFGKVWTTAMIAQVALTVICIIPAKGISEEAVRDRVIRSRFPAAQYLAVEIKVDRAAAVDEGKTATSADRVDQIYGELQRRIAQEPGVRAIAFGDRLPGMDTSVRRAQVEVSTGAEPITVPNLWIASVGPGYFEMFDRPILSGRDFHAGDLASGARSVLVNEAFARRYTKGSSPVGLRVRYADSERATPESWLDIVGMVRDIGMTPTDFGEAPYVFHPASPATASPLMMSVRLAGDPSALAPRVREIAAAVDPEIRLGTIQPLDEVVWSYDAAMLGASGGIAGVVSLGLFLSTAGIFSLMSVSVARRRREIGLRVALGASPGRVIVGLLSRALALIGGGIAAGSAVLILFVILVDADDVTVGFVVRELLITSWVMLIVGLLGCVEPTRRALRINPTEALKEA